MCLQFNPHRINITPDARMSEKQKNDLQIRLFSIVVYSNFTSEFSREISGSEND